MARLVVEQGCIGSRIVWVLVRGLVTDILFVGVYLPHKARKEPPYQYETIDELDDFLGQDKWKSVCKVMLGDLNCKLQRGLKGLVGDCCMHHKPDTGGIQMQEMMRRYQLVASGTDFRRKKRPNLGCSVFSEKEPYSLVCIDVHKFRA